MRDSSSSALQLPTVEDDFAIALNCASAAITLPMGEVACCLVAASAQRHLLEVFVVDSGDRKTDEQMEFC
jgi:hypothetical protein